MYGEDDFLEEQYEDRYVHDSDLEIDEPDQEDEDDEPSVEQQADAMALESAFYTRQEAAGRDASLGVGHVWSNTRCPAYATYAPEDCTCTKR